MLFIGDSTVEQASATVMNMITLDNGECEDQISYARSEVLYQERDGERRFEQNVLKYIPDIVITSVGPWLKKEADLAEIFDYIQKFLHSQAKEITKPIKYFWKTQSPGHVDCPKYSEPVTSEFSRKNQLPQRKNTQGYHWEIFPNYDEMMRKFVTENSETWGLIDTSPLYLRPDSHSHYNIKHDCIHYCMPGPIHLVSVLLLQMLSTQEM
jgi:hypothetical protein